MARRKLRVTSSHSEKSGNLELYIAYAVLFYKKTDLLYYNRVCGGLNEMRNGHVAISTSCSEEREQYLGETRRKLRLQDLRMSRGVLRTPLWGEYYNSISEGGR